AASINCGYTRDGLPIGLQIAGRRTVSICSQQRASCSTPRSSKRRPWPEAAAARAAA
ncbi:amidase, partial [Burkholderia multivorans]